MLTIAQAAEIVADVMAMTGSADAAWAAVTRVWPGVSQHDQDQICEVAAARLRKRAIAANSRCAPFVRT